MWSEGEGRRKWEQKCRQLWAYEKDFKAIASPLIFIHILCLLQKKLCTNCSPLTLLFLLLLMNIVNIPYVLYLPEKC